jgi:hypothetical protein
MRKLSFVVPVAALVVLGMAQPAAAARPDREPSPLTGSADLIGICAFPIHLEATGTQTTTTFTNRNGDVTRIEVHAVEQDVFTGPTGKTLIGSPYTYNVHVLFDPGNPDPTHVYATGVTSRVPLPGGDVFLSAGRADFVAHPDVPFLLQPDVGAQGNLAGFCAALAP